MNRKSLVLIVTGCFAVLILALILARPRANDIPAISSHMPVTEPGTERGSVVSTQKFPERHPAPSSPRVRMLKELEGVVTTHAVRQVIGLDPEAQTYNERIQAYRELPLSLSTNDVAALRLFLETEYDDGGKMTLMEFDAVKNNVLDHLIRQAEPPEGLGLQLAEMYRDRGYDEVWRDYCIQYLAGYYKARNKPGGGPANDPESREIRAVYYEALSEKENTIAGTALIGVERLSRAYPGFDRDRIRQAALGLAADNTCSEASRITALRVCGAMGNHDVLPAARNVAETGDTTLLRLAAIATIGDLGGSADAEFLKTLAAGPDKRIGPVAEAALARLDARTGEQTTEPISGF